MKPKTTEKRKPAAAGQVVSMPMIGPGRPARCIMCEREFTEGQPWRKMTRDGYTVGTHDACLTAPKG